MANSLNEHSGKYGMEVNLNETTVMTMGGIRKREVEHDCKVL